MFLMTLAQVLAANEKTQLRRRESLLVGIIHSPKFEVEIAINNSCPGAPSAGPLTRSIWQGLLVNMHDLPEIKIDCFLKQPGPKLAQRGDSSSFRRSSCRDSLIGNNAMLHVYNKSAIHDSSRVIKIAL